jgi:putative addiction module component (TIGR02574 family)
MAEAATKVLSEARKLSARERVRVAEQLLASAEAEGYDDDSDAAIPAAWADEIQRRSRELRDGAVRGLSVDEARRLVVDRR